MLPGTASAVADQPREPIFTTIASIALWCIWKARCLHVLSHTLRPLWIPFASFGQSSFILFGVSGMQHRDPLDPLEWQSSGVLPFFRLGDGLQSSSIDLLVLSYGIMPCQIGLFFMPLISHLETLYRCIQIFLIGTTHSIRRSYNLWGYSTL